MSISQKAVRLVAAVGAAIVAGTLFGLTTAPAAAEAPNTTTSVTSLQTTQDDNLGECSGDKCKKINVCPPSGRAPIGIAADAPLVLLGDDSDVPPCIKEPQLVPEACCVQGKADVTVSATNPNSQKIWVRVRLDNGAWVVKGIGGKKTVVFEFKGVGNGKHVIHSAIWAGGDTWCSLKDKYIEVKCASASPSPSGSPSHSHSPSPSHSVSPSASPTPSELPQTGNNIVLWAVPIGFVRAACCVCWRLGAGEPTYPNPLTV